VSGLAFLQLLDGASYYLPCDIEWSPEGNYLLFQRKHKDLVSDDIFVIKSIHILEDSKVSCKLYNSIETPNGEKFDEVIVGLYFDQYDKIITSGIAENVIDMAIVGDTQTKSEPETETKPVEESETVTEPEKIIKKAKWYKPWRYFW